MFIVSVVFSISWEHLGLYDLPSLDLKFIRAEPLLVRLRLGLSAGCRCSWNFLLLEMTDKPLQVRLGNASGNKFGLRLIEVLCRFSRSSHESSKASRSE